MTRVTEIRKSVSDATPLLAAVGVTDLAIEGLRRAGGRASAARAELSAARAELNPEGLARSYGSLASRGERLVQRVRRQKATKDLLAQADTTVSLGKGALTSVRRAATDIERSARATLTVGRREAASTASVAAGAAARQAEQTAGAARGSATRTRTAAKRTGTTARKRTTTASAAAKRATTSAQKTAAAAVEAAEQTADKVGD